ncbi:AraC family transcriptional regulator [Paenibacillus eucommiae]|uniref:AraC-like DNA-binding protein n=1 Tax=Paenibacillus eucommiae TaxID=1355755 RepID=A0ABS4INV8_9BACL|nr:AraC family transcriptional regulator [Paenibacillus eucommiae]MBP1988726.1 AraC-like DNA-binding protein [Paenibacillus eucommiae]
MQYLFQLSRVYSGIQIISIHHIHAEKSWSFPNHRHTIMEFTYCLKGSSEQKVNGKRYILTKGDAIFIKSGVYHELKIQEDGEFFSFHFDIEIPTIYSIFQSVNEPFIFLQNTPFIGHWVETFLSDFGGDFAQLHHLPHTTVQYTVDQNLKMLQMHSSFVDFISTLAKHFYGQQEQQEKSVQASHLYIAHQVAFELNNTSQYNLQIGELAHKLNVHRSHITNCFKEVYGVTPKHYLLQLRTQKAKQYLLETNLTMEEIADQLTLSSAAHFTKFFINQTGVSPSQFRAKRGG